MPRMSFAALLLAAACGSGSGSAPAHVEIALAGARQFVAHGNVHLRVVGSPGPDSVELMVDGSDWRPLPVPFQFDWNADAAPEGPHRFRVRGLVQGSWFESAEVLITVDRTPPQVVSVEPPSGATLSANDPILIRFTEPVEGLDAILIHPHSIDRTMAAFVGRLDDVTVVARYPFSSPDVVDLAVNPATTDRAGNPVAGATPWSYAINSPWDLLGGGPVAAGQGGGERPALFVAGGEVHATSHAFSGPQVVKYAAGTWQTVVPASSPNVVTDGTNLWSYDGFANRWNGTAWEPQTAAAIEPALDSQITAMQFLGTPYGPVIVWSETAGATSIPTGTALRAARPFNGAWVEVAPLAVAVDAQLVSAVVWQGSVFALYAEFESARAAVGALRLARVDSGSVVLQPGSIGGVTRLVGSGVQAVVGPDLSVFSTDNGLLPPKWLLFARANDTWDPVPNGGVPATALALPDLAVDGRGRRFAAFTCCLASGGQVHVALWNGTAWTEPWGQLNIDPQRLAVNPRLGIDVDGALLVAWPELDGDPETTPGAAFHVYVKRLSRD